MTFLSPTFSGNLSPDFSPLAPSFFPGPEALAFMALFGAGGVGWVGVEGKCVADPGVLGVLGATGVEGAAFLYSSLNRSLQRF